MKCSLEDVPVLRQIGQETYFDTFAFMNTPENMDAYLRDAFSPERITSELQMTTSAFYFLQVKGILAGYLEINLAPSQSDLNESRTLEIERIYIVNSCQGSGFGKRLLQAAERIGLDLGCTSTWLGVWEKNVKAIGFYERMGYAEVQRHSFRMGKEVQSDLIMKKSLASGVQNTEMFTY
jgi:diamine N-acetyltransferase